MVATLEHFASRWDCRRGDLPPSGIAALIGESSRRRDGDGRRVGPFEREVHGSGADRPGAMGDSARHGEKLTGAYLQGFMFEIDR